MSASESKLIAARYVRALVSLAAEQKQLDAVEKDLLTLRSALGASDALMKFLYSPLASRNKSAEVMVAVLAKLNAHELTKGFVTLLAANRRLGLLLDAIELFLAELAKVRGEAWAEVTAAYALSPEHIRAVEAALEGATGKTVKVKMQENPDILGGLIIKIGGRMMDHSLAGKLARMKRDLGAATGAHQ